MFLFFLFQNLCFYNYDVDHQTGREHYITRNSTQSSARVLGPREIFPAEKLPITKQTSIADAVDPSEM